MDKYFESRTLSWIHSYIVTVTQNFYFNPTKFIEKAEDLKDLISRVNQPFLKKSLPYLNVIRRSVYFLQLLYKLKEQNYSGRILSQRNSDLFNTAASLEGIDISNEIMLLNKWNSEDVKDIDLLSAYVSILLKVYRIEEYERKAFKIDIEGAFLYGDQVVEQ